VKLSPDDFTQILAKVMLWGVLLAAGIMLVGGTIYLVGHGGDSSATRDHIFTGEPRDLRHPVDIVRAAFQDNTTALIQVGVLLLLFNPLVRVLLAMLGYAAQRDRLYTVVSFIVLLVLIYSFLA